MIRPYLSHGAIMLRFPRRFGIPGHVFDRYFRIGHRVRIAWDILLSFLSKNHLLHSVEDADTRDRYRSAYREAAGVAQEIHEKIRRRSGSVPVVYMPADDDVFFNALLREGIPDRFWIDEPSIAIRQHQANGEQVLVSDGLHWNVPGHAYAGCALLQALLIRNFVPAVLSLLPETAPGTDPRITAEKSCLKDSSGGDPVQFHRIQTYGELRYTSLYDLL
jgi:hypothetical protein